MKFLVDNALSPLIATELRIIGHDAVHIRDFGMQSDSDEVIFNRAVEEKRIIVSADTDFATLLALRNKDEPSVILFRRSSRRPVDQATLLIMNLPVLEQPLNEGSIIILEDTRIRVRSLPINKQN